MVGPRVAVVRKRWGLAFLVAGVFAAVGCSTDVVPRAPDLRSDQESAEETGDEDTSRAKNFLRRFSDDFQMLYAGEQPWRPYLLVQLGVRFLRNDGMETYESRPDSDREYPGIEKFRLQVQTFGGPWRYLGHLAKTTRLRPEVRKAFRSDLNFQPALELSLAMQLYRRESEFLTASDVFRSRPTDPAFRKPLLRSLLLLVTAQHFGAAQRAIPESDRAYRAFVRERLKHVLDEWKKQLASLRNAWNPTFDIPLVSASTLRYMQRTFTDRQTYEFSFATGTFEEVEESLPLQEVYRGAVIELPEKIRALHTEAIESFVEQRVQSTLRNRVLLLAQMIKFQRYRDLLDEDSMSDAQARYYLTTSIDEIARVLQKH